MATIAEALAPLRPVVIQRAVDATKDRVDRLNQALVAAGGSVYDVFPKPDASKDSRAAYLSKKRVIDFVRSIFTSDAVSCRPNDPLIVRVNQNRVDHLLQETAKAAALDFEAFVAKLTKKVGDVVDAKLTRGVENSLWTFSDVTVTKADGSTETWRTRMIVNISVLGKLFNQWPTRRL